MASQSISTSEVSPKAPLPTKQSVMAEAKANIKQELSTPNNTSPSNLQKVVAELVGTYILIFVGCGSILQAQKLFMVGIAIAWGAILMADIYAVGHISGAHFNPAVTIAFATGGKFPWKHVPMYILAQVLGATLASLTLKVLFHHQGNFQVTVNQYSHPTSDLEAIVWEFIITFFLMFCICCVAIDQRASKDFAAIAIGGTLFANALIAGPVTGASMNPARSLGPAIVSGVYKNLWVFIVSPILGALAGILVYTILQVTQPEKIVEDTKSIYNHLYLPEP